MAEDRNYNIIIRNETDGEGTPVATKEGKTTEAGKPSNARNVAKSAEKGIISVQTIKPYVQQIAGASVAQIGNATGAFELQQRTTILMNGAGTAMAAGTMVATGNYVGLALLGITETVNIANRAIQIDIAKKMEQEQIGLRKSRLGMSTDRSRWR